MLKKGLIKLFCLLALFLFFGTFSTQALAKGQLSEIKSLNAIEQAAQHNKWGIAENQFKQLEAISRKNLWKYQLYSEEKVYRSMQQELTKLNGAIKAHDRTQSLVETSYLRSLYTQMYRP